MGRSSVGLDIGTRAVRAVELRNAGGKRSIARFGRVLLPVGAVDHGEVQNPAAVSEAIQTLWRRLRLTARRVHIGMANRRVVVRAVELPAMSKEDLHSAIKLQAQDYIPIPLTEAVMDYEILGSDESADGTPIQRVLVVAAERASVDPLVEAVQDARLEPLTLELNAYPLVRCLGSKEGTAEAIVDIGAGVTNVVIQQGGRIRFTRILPNFGGDDFTEAIMQGLEVDADKAESLKRELGGSLAKRISDGVQLHAPAAHSFAGAESSYPAAEPGADLGGGVVAVERTPVDLMEPVLHRLVSEIRGSVEFYTSQSSALPVTRIVLTGGGSLLGGLREAVEDSLATKTIVGHPFGNVELGRMDVSSEQINVAERYLSVAVGLAMAGGGR